MNDAKMAGRYAVVSVLELLRIPAYTVPTLLFPTLLYAFFGIPNSSSPGIGNILLGSYLAFAVLGVALFQFGVGIATDRLSPWESYLRTLPAPVWVRFVARVGAALVFAVLASLGVAVAGALFGHAAIGLGEILEILVALTLGGVVFAMLGIVIGYFASPRGALPIANLIYLPLVFVGGLWVPPLFLPRPVAVISPYTPTRQFGELMWAAASGRPLSGAAVVALVAFGVLFSTFAFWGYRRDEGRRFA